MMTDPIRHKEMAQIVLQQSAQSTETWVLTAELYSKEKPEAIFSSTAAMFIALSYFYLQYTATIFVC